MLVVLPFCVCEFPLPWQGSDIVSPWRWVVREKVRVVVLGEHEKGHPPAVGESRAVGLESRNVPRNTRESPNGAACGEGGSALLHESPGAMKRSGAGGATQHKRKILRDRFLYSLVKVDPHTFELHDPTPAQLDEFETKHPYIAQRCKAGPNGKLNWQAHAQQILKHIMQLRIAKPFLQPVDPVALQLHDYFAVVKKPMDLGTINRHLVGGLHATLPDFQAAVHLSFDNAMLYNPPGNVIHEDAHKLKGIFDRKCSQIHQASEAGQPAMQVSEEGKPTQPSVKATTNTAAPADVRAVVAEAPAPAKEQIVMPEIAAVAQQTTAPDAVTNEEVLVTSPLANESKNAGIDLSAGFIQPEVKPLKPVMSDSDDNESEDSGSGPPVVQIPSKPCFDPVDNSHISTSGKQPASYGGKEPILTHSEDSTMDPDESAAELESDIGDGLADESEIGEDEDEVSESDLFDDGDEAEPSENGAAESGMAESDSEMNPLSFGDEKDYELEDSE